MITTVTLNPAVDKTIEIDDFKTGLVNRVKCLRQDAGGKGINVSKVIKSLGYKSRALGVLSGNTGEFIKEYLDLEGIENDFLMTRGETRTNIKIVDNIKHTNTDINENGPFLSAEDKDRVKSKICKELNDESVVVLAGSVPGNLDKNIYRDFIEMANNKGAKTILDADGELLKNGIKAGPYLIKPNIHELEKLFNQKIESREETVRLSRELFKYGIEIIVISLGDKGALFIKKNKAAFAHGLAAHVRSTVGAGDAMVAALSVSVHEGFTFEKSIKLACACGTANVTTSGTQAADIDTVAGFEKQVEFEYLNI